MELRGSGYFCGMKKYLIQIEESYFLERYEDWRTMEHSQRNKIVDDLVRAIEHLGQISGTGFVLSVVRNLDLSGRIRFYDLGEKFEIAQVDILEEQTTHPAPERG